jgi:hypothetical protein
MPGTKLVAVILLETLDHSPYNADLAVRLSLVRPTEETLGRSMIPQYSENK